MSDYVKTRAKALYKKATKRFLGQKVIDVRPGNDDLDSVFPYASCILTLEDGFEVVVGLGDTGDPEEIGPGFWTEHI